MEQPFPAVAEVFHMPAGVRSHHGNSGGHPLQDDGVERIGENRGVYKQVGALVLAGDVRNEADEIDTVGDAETIRPLPELALVVGLSEGGRSDEPRPRRRTCGLTTIKPGAPLEPLPT